MPGPKATNRKTQEASPNSPNRKTRARMKRRIDAYPGEYKPGEGLMMHKPGSENRKK